MQRQVQTNFAELQQRLARVLPDVPMISSANKPGVYKSVDSTGNVYLVSILEPLAGVIRRSKRLAMDYPTLMRESGTAGQPGRLKADEGWVLKDD